MDKVVAKIPAGRLGDPDEVAGVVEFLADPESGYITGQVFRQRRPVHVVPRRAGRRRLPARLLPGRLAPARGGGVGYGEDDMTDDVSAAGRTVISKAAVILMTYLNGDVHTLTEIATATGLPLSTAHRLVRELAAWKILERTDDGDYCVGLPLRLIGGAGGTATSLRGTRLSGAAGPLPGSRRRRAARGAGRP